MKKTKIENDPNARTGRTTRLWAACVEFALANPDKKVMWIGLQDHINTMPPPHPPNIRMARPYGMSTIGWDRSCIFKDHGI
jgi:hypothetical protein